MDTVFPFLTNLDKPDVSRDHFSRRLLLFCSASCLSFRISPIKTVIGRLTDGRAGKWEKPS